MSQTVGAAVVGIGAASAISTVLVVLVIRLFNKHAEQSERFLLNAAAAFLGYSLFWCLPRTESMSFVSPAYGGGNECFGGNGQTVASQRCFEAVCYTNTYFHYFSFACLMACLPVMGVAAAALKYRQLVTLPPSWEAVFLTVCWLLPAAPATLHGLHCFRNQHSDRVAHLQPLDNWLHAAWYLVAAVFLVYSLWLQCIKASKCKDEMARLENHPSALRALENNAAQKKLLRPQLRRFFPVLFLVSLPSGLFFLWDAGLLKGTPTRSDDLYTYLHGAAIMLLASWGLFFSAVYFSIDDNRRQLSLRLLANRCWRKKKLVRFDSRPRNVSGVSMVSSNRWSEDEDVDDEEYVIVDRDVVYDQQRDVNLAVDDSSDDEPQLHRPGGAVNKWSINGDGSDDEQQPLI